MTILFIQTMNSLLLEVAKANLAYGFIPTLRMDTQKHAQHLTIQN